jgi:hypothetical protein
MTADGPLGIAEGIETALAMTEINRRATGELFPIWATLGDWGMANMPFPPELKQLLIFADGGKAGVEAAERVQSRALAAGIDPTYYLPKSGDDFARDLELRLWEQQSEPEQDAQSIAQSNGSIAGAHPATGTNPRDGPSVSPPAAAPIPPRAPSEDSNLEQAPTWAASVGPIPPQTLDAILAATTSLTRDLTPETRQNILFILRGVALAGLDSIGERQALDAIKAKTGLPIGDLRRQLAGFRREMGLATARPAQAWTSSLIMGDDGTPRAVMANASLPYRRMPLSRGPFVTTSCCAKQC